jgi:hypothetical protein
MSNNIKEENIELEKLEQQLNYEDDSNELPPNDIVAFNELRSCADLLRMYETNQLDIQPDFQRDVVWSKPDQTRFIDSLIKQLPIPSMCISLDYRTDKRQIIDGLQRMSSIINFLSNDEWKLSQLDDIDENLSGKTVHTIRTKSRDLYSRVQNVVIPITVIRCDYSKKTHSEYLFTIFHRLNSGGIKLNNQEIRNCIFSGSTNNLLKKISSSETVIKAIGEKTRFANEELFLRFFSFNDDLLSYTGKLSTYLNAYMHTRRYIEQDEIDAKFDFAKETVELIFTKIFDRKLIRKISKTTLEGLLYGVSQNLEHLKQMDGQHVKALYQDFIQLEEFSLDNLKEGLAQKDKLINRLTASKNVFSR